MARVTLEAENMQRPVLITTPYPTPEEVARVYGISKRRAAELRKLVEESLAKKGYFGKNGDASSAHKNGVGQKTADSRKSASAVPARATKKAKSRTASRRKLTRAKAKSSH